MRGRGPNCRALGKARIPGVEMKDGREGDLPALCISWRGGGKLTLKTSLIKMRVFARITRSTVKRNSAVVESIVR